MPQKFPKRIRWVPRRSGPAVLAVACCAALALAGCQRKGIEELVSSELFSLSMGKMEDQIDLFPVRECHGRAREQRHHAGRLVLHRQRKCGQDHGVLFVRRPDIPPLQRPDESRADHAWPGRRRLRPPKRPRAASSRIPSPTSGISRWRATVPCTWKMPSPMRRPSRTPTAG